MRKLSLRNFLNVWEASQTLRNLLKHWEILSNTPECLRRFLKVSKLWAIFSNMEIMLKLLSLKARYWNKLCSMTCLRFMSICKGSNGHLVWYYQMKFEVRSALHVWENFSKLEKISQEFEKVSQTLRRFLKQREIFSTGLRNLLKLGKQEEAVPMFARVSVRSVIGDF